ncbi:MAG: hypothetical protein P8K08_25060 [Fuerstiella sp.]|nr:hypothetical protein [Fuerstiella sp.]
MTLSVAIAGMVVLRAGWAVVVLGRKGRCSASIYVDDGTLAGVRL